jgi:hypothetical protein
MIVDVNKFNHMCATFLGGVHYPKMYVGGDMKYVCDVWEKLPNELIGDINSVYIYSKHLRFDKDWNWLMYVVVEIEKMEYGIDIYTPNSVELFYMGKDRTRMFVTKINSIITKTGYRDSNISKYESVMFVVNEFLKQII